MNPWPIVALALLVGSFLAGWVKGNEHGTEKLTDYIGKQAVETVRVARARDIVTVKVETKYLPQITREHVITETIEKEIHAHANPNDPPVAGSFRVWHDSAAQGLVPDTARLADGAAVAVEDASSTVATNYGQCRADQLKLRGLQEWVTEQGKVK